MRVPRMYEAQGARKRLKQVRRPRKGAVAGRRDTIASTRPAKIRRPECAAFDGKALLDVLEHGVHVREIIAIMVS